MPSDGTDDLARQVSELTAALAEAEGRWTAGLLNFAGQLEEAYGRGEERGRARGWADCARHFGLPLAAAGRHRRRHLSAIPGGAAGVAAVVAWRLAGTAKTATTATAVLARYTAAHSAAATGVAAVSVAAGVGVTVALAPPASHPPAATPPVSSRPVSAATMPAAPLAPWRPVRMPAGVSVASAAPDSTPPPVPVTAPVVAVPVTSAAVPADTPASPADTPAPQASDPTDPVTVPVAAAAAPVASTARHRMRDLGDVAGDLGAAVGGVTDPGAYAGHHRRDLPVPVPSAPASVIPVPVPSISLPSVLGG